MHTQGAASPPPARASRGAAHDHSRARPPGARVQVLTKSTQNISSIADMQRFVESYPEFRARSGNVSKHVTLMGELSRLVDERRLMGVSQLEQELACAGDRAAAFAGVQEQLEALAVRDEEKLKLLLLFALRYEREAAAAGQVEALLGAAGLADRRGAEAVVRTALAVAGEAKRTGDLYGSKNLLSRAQRIVGGIKGVDNVYTQHQPLLATTVDNLVKGKGREADYPYVGPALGPKDRPQDVVIFVVGGATYEEARAVAAMNAAAKREGTHQRFLLGGTTLLNSASFLGVLRKMCEDEELL